MKKLFIFLIVIFFSHVNNINSIENKILFKINEEIITSIDLKNEINYLIATNQNLKTLEKNQIIEIAKNSLIREKIKKLELLKYIKSIEIEKKFLNNIIQDLFLRINLKNEEELKKYLNQRNVKYSYMINKLSLNTLWNKLIFEKYSSQVIINKQEIKKEILGKKNLLKQFNLSEIVFEIEKTNNLKNKFIIIKKNIKEFGFESSAVRFSISNSSNRGGKIGWISESSLNKKILSEVNKLSQGEFTNPITIPGGFIIIKLNGIKEEKKEIDLDNEIEKVIRFKTNEQLNTFSNIYLKKIMKDNEIEQI
tara:strand:- start:434 stop:1357 length:924 start_codon:yes stop_codon:yes gene_type:complete